MRAVLEVQSPRANLGLRDETPNRPGREPEERFLFVEWIDIGAQWDNIPGPDSLPGYKG